MPSWMDIEPAQPENSAPEAESQQAEAAPYLPLTDTIRLYAGWLLAWYCMVYALGSYQVMRDLPFSIPLVESLLLSPLVLSFALASFLYLLLANLHSALGGGKAKAWALTLIGVVAFMLYRMNVG